MSAASKSFAKTMHELLRRSNQKTAHGPFCCRQPPPISLDDYATRIYTYMQASDQAYTIACIYLALIFKTDRAIISPLSAHKLMMATITVAAKWTDDVYYTNRHYADVGGVPLWELNQLEANLLGLLGWNVFVNPEIYFTALKMLENPSAVSNDLTTVVPEKYIPKTVSFVAHGTIRDTWDDEMAEVCRGVGAGKRTQKQPGVVNDADDFDAQDQDDDMFGGIVDAIASSMQANREYGKTPMAPHMRPTAPISLSMQGFSLI